MNGIHFYQEFRDKSKAVSAGTVVAVLVCNGPFWSSGKICFEAVVGLFDHANSVVCGGSVSLDYLREKCRRIGETQARAIHPALLERLDQPEHDQEKSTSTKASRVR
jgi:hypothetical protein